MEHGDDTLNKNNSPSLSFAYFRYRAAHSWQKFDVARSVTKWFPSTEQMLKMGVECDKNGLNNVEVVEIRVRTLLGNAED